MVGTAGLARELTELVRMVPGVSTVYDAAPVAAHILTTTVALVSGESSATSLVAVTDRGTGLSVAVSIGVTDASPAPEVCRRVYDVVADYLRAHGATAPTTISVKVGSIG